MNCCRSTEGGFTLLELLVALGLIATLLTAMFVSLRSVLDVSVQLDRGGVKQANVRMLLGLLRRDILSLSDADDDGAGPLLQVEALGFGPDRPVLRLSSSYTLREGLVPAVRVVDYSLRKGKDDSYDLIRRVAPTPFDVLAADGAVSTEPWELKVAEGVKRFSVYADQAPTWDSRVKGEGQGVVPSLLAVVISFVDGPRGDEPLTVVIRLEDNSVLPQ